MHQHPREAKKEHIPRHGFYFIERSDHVDIYLNGEFFPIEENAQFFEELEQLPLKYREAVIWISSPGGLASTASYILDVMARFGHVITICTTTMSSAGTLIWCNGDVRVISENAHVMIHRESFGVFGKAGKVENILEVSKEIGERLFINVARFMTDTQIETARHTEVYLNGFQFIEKGHGMSYTEYHKRTDMASYAEYGILLKNALTDELILVKNDTVVKGIQVTSPEEIVSLPWTDYVFSNDVQKSETHPAETDVEPAPEQKETLLSKLSNLFRRE